MDTNYISSVQVSKEHYKIQSYVKKQRWLNFYYQIQSILQIRPQNVLEIGPGPGIVTDTLRKSNISVVTLDIDPNNASNVIGCVMNLPFMDKSFDVVLCSQVLEHISYDFFKTAINSLYRVSKKYIIIGLPHSGIKFQLQFKVPYFNTFSFFKKLPFFWRKHSFDGQHYWEVGKRHYLKKQIRNQLINWGYKIDGEQFYFDDPGHWILTLRRQ